MRTALALACAGGLAISLAGGPALAGSPATSGGSADAGANSRFIDVTGFDGARGFDIGASGKTVIAESDGTVSRVFRSGDKAGTSNKIAQVPPNFVAPSLAVADDNAVWILTAGGEGPTSGLGSLFLKKPGKHKKLIANVQEWQGAHNPDPFDLEDFAEDSNPYNVAAVPDGSALVADAANNSVIQVWRDGTVKAIARVKPRVVEMPPGFDDPEMPPAGTPMPAEAVVTSVAYGPDGSTYIGELRGFPATPGTSEIWRIKPGATDAICRPKKPDQGPCRRIADGLTSIVSLETGDGGSIYAAELSKMSWLAIEGDPPAEGSEIGAVIRISHDRKFRSELSPGEVVLPGAVAVGPNGAVFVSGPIFGPGGFKRVG